MPGHGGAPIGPSWPGRVAAAHTVPARFWARSQAGLKPEQAAKINMPVLLLTGEESTDPSKAQVGAVAAALARAAVVRTGPTTASPTSWTRRLSRNTC